MVAATKKRGRPAILTAEQSLAYNQFLFGSQRSVTNMHYVSAGSVVATEAIGADGLLRSFNIGPVGYFGNVRGPIKGKAILEQVGRMKLQDNYDDNLCKQVLVTALRLRDHDGWTVKDIERWIRGSRATGVFFSEAASENGEG